VIVVQINLTPEQETFVQQALRSGRIDRPEDAVTEASCSVRNARCCAPNGIASLNEARGSITRGEGRIITQASMQALADEAKQRLLPFGHGAAFGGLDGAPPSAAAERDLNEIAWVIAKERQFSERRTVDRLDRHPLLSPG
jgi:hypothetical protein